MSAARFAEYDNDDGRKRIEEDLAEKTEDLEILNRIALELSSALELDALLRRIVENAVELSSADAGAIAISDPETRDIIYPYIANMPSEIFGVRVARGQGFAGRMIESKKPTIIRDYPAFPQAVPEFVEAGVAEVAAVPLMSRDQAVGALGVFMLSHEKQFSSRSLRLLEGVGGLAGVAMENARLFATERREREVLAVLEEISRAALTLLSVDALLNKIASSVVDKMDICCGTVFILEDGWLVVRSSTGMGALHKGSRVRYGEGFAGEVASTGRTIAVTNAAGYSMRAEERSRPMGASFIGVPVKVRDRTIGVLRFDTARRHEFSRDEIRLFNLLADRAAITIEMVKLFEAEKKRTDETRALMHLTSDIFGLLDTDEMLRHVAQQSSELVDAEICFIPIMTERAYLKVREIYRSSKGWVPFRGVWRTGEDVPGRVFETREILIIDDVKRSPLVDKERAVELGIRNMIAAPIIQRSGEPIAVLVVANKAGDASFNSRDAELLKAVIGQTAIGIENARLYEDQRHIAQTLQKSLLREKLPDIPNTELGVSYTSATSAATAGGDFYDVIDLPDGRVAFLIGDVSGKGVEAATTSSMTRFLVRVLTYESPDPASVLARANNILYREGKVGEFVTMFFGILNPRTGKLVYSSAGHPPPFTCGLIACIALDDRQELVSGVFPDVTYRNGEVEFAPGNGLVLYTDGLVEARRDTELFGERRLQRVIAEHTTASAQELASDLMREVKDYTGDRLTDDVAIVVIKRESARQLKAVRR